jgi:hypothetical protein
MGIHRAEQIHLVGTFEPLLEDIRDEGRTCPVLLQLGECHLNDRYFGLNDTRAERAGSDTIFVVINVSRFPLEI